MRDKVVRLCIGIIKKVIEKRIAKTSDERLKDVLIGSVELALTILTVFVDSNKDNKAQLKELKPHIIDTITDIAFKAIDLDD